MKKEILSLIENLKSEKKELYRKKKYMMDHNFSKEADHIQTKISVVEEILFGIEWVADGTKKGSEISFNL